MSKEYTTEVRTVDGVELTQEESENLLRQWRDARTEQPETD